MAKFFLATVQQYGNWVETMFNEDAVEHIESKGQKAWIKLKGFNEPLECKENLDVLKERIFPRSKTFMERLFGLWD